MAQVAEDLRFLLQQAKILSTFMVEVDVAREGLEPILEWHLGVLSMLQQPGQLSEVENRLLELRGQPGMSEAVAEIEKEVSAIRKVFEWFKKKMSLARSADPSTTEADDALPVEQEKKDTNWQLGLLQTLLKSLTNILKGSASPLLKTTLELVDEGIDHIRSRNKF